MEHTKVLVEVKSRKPVFAEDASSFFQSFQKRIAEGNGSSSNTLVYNTSLKIDADLIDKLAVIADELENLKNYSKITENKSPEITHLQSSKSKQKRPASEEPNIEIQKKHREKQKKRKLEG
jgi:hypothetical protein